MQVAKGYPRLVRDRSLKQPRTTESRQYRVDLGDMPGWLESDFCVQQPEMVVSRSNRVVRANRDAGEHEFRNGLNSPVVVYLYFLPAGSPDREKIAIFLYGPMIVVTMESVMDY
jgi:hypothetical protein